MKPRLSIIIVHYHNKKVLFNCLESIKKNLKIKHEVIVVDNDEKASLKKQLTTKFPEIFYLKAPGNIGFGAGCNLGSKKAKADLLFFLNPDTVLLKDSVKPLVSYLKSHSKVKAVAPLLLDKKKKPYPIQGTTTLTPLKALISLSFLNKLLPRNPISQSYWINVSGKNKPIKADVLPGSAFLIYKNIFIKHKGFDNKYFLYFEETDLFKRLTEKGHQLYILPQAKLIHYWAQSTPKTKKILQIFKASRFYYLKKHFGFIKALLTESFLRLTHEAIALSLIILLATWLRFVNLPELMSFIGDQGRDYLSARNMVLTGQWPLVGIASSVPWLKQGVFFIWLTALALKLGQFNPVAPAVMTSTLGVLTVFFTYKLNKTWFNSKIAIISSLIMATSPLAVIHSRLPYHISPIPLFSSLYLISLSINSVFWTFFLSGILLQFELTTLPLLVLAIWFFWKSKSKILPHGLIFFLPFLPKIVYDLTHGFQQTVGFIAWLGYRLVNFLNPFSEHGLNNLSIIKVSQTIFKYWQKFIIYDQPIIAGLIALLSILTIYKTKHKFKKLLVSFLALNFLAFFIHAGPSEAYFPVLFPAFVLIISLILDQFKKPFFYLTIIVLSLYNSYFLLTNNFVPYGPTLSQRLNLVKLIKSNKKTFKLNNPATNQFESYLDNYRYLFWWQEFPEDRKANLIITINE